MLGDHRDLVVALGVAVQHQQRRVRARRQRGDDLAAARDVEPEPLLDHHALHGGARERLRGEHDARARPAGGEPVGVLARTRAQRGLGHDQHGRLELGGERVGAAALDGQHPVGVERAAGREQRQQSVDADDGHDPTLVHRARRNRRGTKRIAFGLSTVGQTRARAMIPPWPRPRRCAGSPRSARSSAPTRRRSTSSRRRRSTCSASTAGCGTSSTSTTSTRSRATTRACSCRRRARTTSSSRWRTSATTCSSTRRCATACRRTGPGGKAVFVMFDDETEAAAAEAGLEIAHPSAELRHRLDSKIVTTQLGNEAGVPSAPNTLGRATTLRRADRARRVGRPRRRPRRADALRRLGQDHVLHPRAARLGQERRGHGRRRSSR